MKIPKTINVFGVKWKVKIKETVLVGDVECLGSCNVTNNTIELSKNIPKGMLLEVFLHEYFHAVWYGLGIDDEGSAPWVEHIYIVPLSKQMSHCRKLFASMFKQLG